MVKCCSSRISSSVRAVRPQTLRPLQHAHEAACVDSPAKPCLAGSRSAHVQRPLDAPRSPHGSGRDTTARSVVAGSSHQRVEADQLGDFRLPIVGIEREARGILPTAASKRPRVNRWRRARAVQSCAVGHPRHRRRRARIASASAWQSRDAPSRIYNPLVVESGGRRAHPCWSAE